MLNIMSLFRNSINGLKGLGVTNDTDKGTFSPLASPKLDKKHITFDEYITLSGLIFNWADSYDTKDWDRLSGIIAPVLFIDYTLISGRSYPSMPAASFLAMISSPGFLGDPLLKTQHLLGACEWEKVSDDYVIGRQQLRAGHLRFEDESHKVEKKRGHSHATNEFYFRRVEVGDGSGRKEWKWAGLKPAVRWNEYEFETIFGGFECPKV